MSDGHGTEGDKLEMDTDDRGYRLEVGTVIGDRTVGVSLGSDRTVTWTRSRIEGYGVGDLR